MAIYTGGAVTRRGRLLEEFPAPLEDVLRATAEEAWVRSPLSSLDRLEELREAEQGELVFSQDRFGNIRWERREPESPRLTAEEARARVESEGLDLKIPDQGIRAETLDLLIERKRAEVRRRAILDRAPRGVTPALLQFGTALGVSMLDPINIGSAFVPVVGPARYAKLVSGASGALGRAAVRARVGLVEGAVGAALVEPIVYAAAEAEQADYGLADSFMNVVFGSVMGGGLHAGLGAVSDALARNVPWQEARPQGELAERISRRWSPQERQQALDLAVSQAIVGRQIDVEPLVELRDAINAVRPSTLEEARVQAAESLHEEFRRTLTPEAERALSKGEVKRLRGEQKNLQHDLERLEESFKVRARTLQREEGLSRKQAEARARREIDAERERIGARLTEIDESLRTHEVASAARADISRLEQGLVPERFRERVEREARARYEQARRPLDAQVREALGRNPPPRLARAWSALHEAARQQSAPERVRLVDLSVADRITQEVREGPQAADLETAQVELQEELQRLQELSEALDEDANARLVEYDERIAEAETFGRALRQMALCGLRRTA